MNWPLIMHRHEARSVTLKLPEGEDAIGLAAFVKIARLVQKEWSVRASAASPKPSLAPIPWLSTTAYVVVGAMLDQGLEELLKKRIGDRIHHLPGPRTDLNPFQLGLMALFVDYSEAKKAGTPQAKRPQTRERIGKELWYAYRHYVPAEFLLGFLHQVRSPGLERRSVAGEIEPGFEEWIIRRRPEDEGQYDRGLYPQEIEDVIERRMDEDADWDEEEEDPSDEDYD